MAICHWTVYRPDLLPPSGVFLIGILLDLLAGTPYVGLSALTLLVARGLILAARRHIVKQSFAIVWAGFAVVAAAVIGLEWLLIGGLNATLVGSRPFLFQIVVTVAAFPLVSYLLTQIQRASLSRL
jgi:rod shape-determining protein MreD